MYKNNFKENMRSHYNTFRLFAVDDESGAVICDYPEGRVKPAIPIPYAQETMHGFEYAFAGLLMSRGYIDEGLRVVRGVRDRYTGDNRNPWNEIECGSNYARSMASFALIPILSGQKTDLTRGYLAFAPKLAEDNFRCVFAAGSAWGRVTLRSENRLDIFAGELKLRRLELPVESVSEVIVDGKPVEFSFEDGAICFDAVARESVVVK